MSLDKAKLEAMIRSVEELRSALLSGMGHYDASEFSDEAPEDSGMSIEISDEDPSSMDDSSMLSSLLGDDEGSMDELVPSDEESMDLPPADDEEEEMPPVKYSLKDMFRK